MGFLNNFGGGDEGCGGGFGCIINLIVILIVLQFICSLFFNNSGGGCDECSCGDYDYEGYVPCGDNSCSNNACNCNYGCGGNCGNGC